MESRKMQRREILAAGSAAVMGLTSFPWGWAAAAETRRPKLLYFTRSVGYEHSVISPSRGWAKLLGKNPHSMG